MQFFLGWNPPMKFPTISISIRKQTPWGRGFLCVCCFCVALCVINAGNLTLHFCRYAEAFVQRLHVFPYFYFNCAESHAVQSIMKSTAMIRSIWHELFRFKDEHLQSLAFLSDGLKLSMAPGRMLRRVEVTLCRHANAVAARDLAAKVVLQSTMLWRNLNWNRWNEHHGTSRSGRTICWEDRRKYFSRVARPWHYWWTSINMQNPQCSTP